jgi:phosphatidylinositol alpha 1,6-mannosyltransferase
MRIAYFNATLRAGQDGVTRVIQKMVEGALKRGCEVVAIGASIPDGPQVVPVLRVPSVALPMHRAYRLALPGYRSFAPVLRTFDPDILHINSPCTLGFSALKYARHFGLPVVGTYHTHFPAYLRYYNLAALGGLAWTLTRRLYNALDRTFVPTVPILRELREHGLLRLQHLPNGVDVAAFNPSQRSAHWRQRVGGMGKPIVLFVSRLVWEKDLRVLAEAYQTLRARRNDFQMVIVGDGHARADLEKMMPGARFLGHQRGCALSESYASSDIFVFPSTTETFGLVTLEAMASGLAPVAARAGGAAAIIEEGKSGLLAEPGSATDLAAKVAWLLNHPDERRRLSHQALRRAEGFGWEQLLRRLFDSYQEIVEMHPRGQKRATPPGDGDRVPMCTSREPTVSLVATKWLTTRSGWSAGSQVGYPEPTEAMPCGLPAWS